MLIFDRFATVARAHDFGTEVGKRYRLETITTTHRRDDLDPFPFNLTPPIVYVERPYDGDDNEIERNREEGVGNDEATAAEIEHEIEALVKDFGGVFAGT
jgi:hypothetical protein